MPPDPAPRRGVRGLLRDLVDFDRRALLILGYVPVALTLLEYVFIPLNARDGRAFRWAREALGVPRAHHELAVQLWWVAGCLLVLVLVPALIVRVGAGVRPSELGVRVRGTGRDALLYAALFVVFVPVVWWVAHRRDFQATYPFFRPPRGMPSGEFATSWPFLVFEAAYFLQFFAVEFFFRGFMTLGLKPALGRASILVMLAPYCMIHYHKPMAEAFGAIGAGLVLGALAWRTRTIVWGWFLHYGVALSMDLLALSRRG